MAKQRLFEYAIIYHPPVTKEDKDAGVNPSSELVKAVTVVLANDDKQVQMLAAREIPDNYVDKLDNVEIAVRPF